MAKIKLVAFRVGDDSGEICRDERCPLEEVHPTHTRRIIVPGGRRKTLVAQPALDVCVFRQVTERCVRTFRDIYNAVVHDYGAITERGVYRAIERLIDTRKIIRVVPWPNGRLYRLGGYLRYDSPLIWCAGGHSSIQEQLQDCGYSEHSADRMRIAKRTLRRQAEKAEAAAASAL